MGEAVPCDGEERQGLGSAGSPENRLSLKPINIPMGGGDEVDDGKSNRVIVEARLECNISSKGLGCSEGFKGRMRARLDDQGNRVSRSNKNKTRNLKNGSEGGVAENIGGTDQAKCPVCSKSFHSKKAMYGHMRCHPEREWRIDPPPSAKTVSCSSVSQGIDGLSHASMTSTVVSSDISPSQPPLQWTKTGRRARIASSTYILLRVRPVISAHRRTKELWKSIKFLNAQACRRGNNLRLDENWKEGQNRIINLYSSSGSSCNISSSQNKGIEEKHQVSERAGLQKRPQLKMLQVGNLRDYPSKKLKIHERGLWGSEPKKMLETKVLLRKKAKPLALPSMPSWWCKIPQVPDLQQELPTGQMQVQEFWILISTSFPNGKRMKVVQCCAPFSLQFSNKEGSKLPYKPINIPMGGGDEVDDGKSSKVIVEARLECNISSKGLGCSEGFKGRMRARLDDQGNRVGRSNKNKTRNLKNGSESGVAENIGGTDQAKCPVCSKGFHSKKAMYGHMRCHPEREWRGINPPPSAKTVSCSSVSQGIDGLSHASMTSTVVSSDISPSQPPLQLTKTGRRARIGSSTHILLRVRPVISAHRRRKKVRKSIKFLNDYPSKKLKIHERGALGFRGQEDAGNKGSASWKDFLKTGFNLGPKEVDTDKKSSDDRIIPGGQLDDQISKNTKKTPKFVSYMDVSDNKRFLKTLLPRTYKHGARNKAFPTYQALTMENKHASSSHAAASEEEGLAVGTSKHAKQVVQKAHKCRTCNKSFPTGQALGGHQTSHRQKPAQLATPRQEALILSDEEASQNAGPRGFMADDVSCEGQEGQNLAPGGGSPEKGHSLKLIKIQTGGGEEDYDTGKRREVIMKTEVVCSSNSKGLRCSKAFKIQTRALLDEQDSDKNKTSYLKNDGSEGGVSEKNTGSEALCPVCSKSFRSKKAVYGHMRCHPDREWRGINPPPSAKSDSCSTVSKKNDDLSPSAMKSTVVSSDTSPSQPLLPWTKTGRRGKNHPLSSSSTSVLSSDLSLSHKHGVKNKKQVSECLGEKKRKQVVVLQLGSLRNYPSKEVSIDGRGTLMLKEKALIDTELGPRDAGLDNNIEEESGSKNTTDRSKTETSSIKNSKRVASCGTQEHKCSTCHKVFPTFQALGGHRSNHSYKNNLQAMDAGEEESKEGSSKVVVDGFKCNICSKNFRSGQALGGHKRAHFQGSTQATPTQDSASGKASESMGNKVLGFDLNELPRMEE
ncbi:hypothetical protein AAG906_005806 [Vitis piasezkii]